LRRIARFLAVTYLWVLLAPYPVMLAGAASNQLVLIANHDRFPVLVNEVKQKMHEDDTVSLNGVTYIDPSHVVMTKQTHLNFLADIFDLHDGIYSVGDGLIGLGEWLESFCIYVWIGLIVRKVCQS
jgi:Family of unknown function (DUF5317)